MTIKTAQHPSTNSSIPALLVFVAGVSAALHVWKLPPALPILQESLALTLTQAGWLMAVFQLAGMLFGLLFGLFVQRLGVKQSIVLGLILLSSASLLGALMHNLIGLLFFRIIEGFALLLVSMSAPSLIRQLAPQGRLNFLLALWSAYFPVASMLSLLFGSIILQYIPWTGLWFGAGGLSLCMAVVLWIQLSSVQLPAEIASQPWHTTKHLIKTTLRLKAPWLLSISFALYSSQWMGVVSFLPVIYHEAGASAALIGILSASIAGLNIFGNLLAGRLLQQGVTAQWILISTFIIMLLMAFIAFGLNLGSWPQFVAIFLFSGLGGMIPATLFNVAVRVAPNPSALPIVVGLQQQWSSLGQFLGPILAAVVVTAYGWDILWYLTGSLAIFGIICSYWLCKTVESTHH